LKRLFDLALATVLLLILWLPILCLMALVRVRIGSPIFFRQQRPGLGGKPFSIVKFRTMTSCQDEDGTLLSDEARLTPFGRFLRSTSFDELPEIWNVLKGDMSFVGPRPLLMEYLDLYSPRQARRHEVRPGLTGWAQVNGRNAISWDQKFEYDVWYVDNRSFWLDMKILCMTAIRVLRREGISQQGHATVERFTGNGRG
jgi:lipopolysaccharide/colanic/teichoic acid biosynthesis glycosyltransferase